MNFFQFDILNLFKKNFGQDYEFFSAIMQINEIYFDYNLLITD